MARSVEFDFAHGPFLWATAGLGEGRFHLYRGDAPTILDRLPAESFNMVFADPPYRLNKGRESWTKSGLSGRTGVAWDASEGTFNDWAFHLRWLTACRRVLKPGGTIWVCGTFHSIHQCGLTLQQTGFHLLNEVVWYKPAPPPNISCRFFTASHETLLWARKERTVAHTFNYQAMKHHGWARDGLNPSGRQMRSVWQISRPNKAERQHGHHPTQKPLELLHRVVLASTKPGDFVLDPFLGSGTTGVAAVLQGRSFVGIDRDESYLDLARKRLHEAAREGLDESAATD